MKKSLLTMFVSLFSIILAVAAPVDEQKARQLASDFLSNMTPHGTRSANAELTRAVTGVADGNDAAIYVFNSDNSFVIISADDRTPAVLGYSDHGPCWVGCRPQSAIIPPLVEKCLYMMPSNLC